MINEGKTQDVYFCKTEDILQLNGWSIPFVDNAKYLGVIFNRGCSKPSNTKILQSFQSKTPRMITGAPWHVSNQTLHEDLKIPLIEDIIKSNIN
jgi:hypothetical protein